MSREIKFRAWDKKTNKMYFVASIDMFGKVVTLLDDRGDTLDFIERAMHSVELMQFTGLLDKNGVEIYEGDIVEGGFENHRGVVTFGNYANPFGGDQWSGYQCFYIKWDEEHADMTRGDTNYWFMNHMETAAEVIGNIYENSDLLKGGL